MKKFWISIFMFVCLALAALGTRPVAALSASGPVGNQVFYSPFIGSLINPVLPSYHPTRLFYSLLSSNSPTRPFYFRHTGSLIPGGTRDLPDPVLSSDPPARLFYSQFIGSLVPGNRLDFPNQVFYSPFVGNIIDAAPARLIPVSAITNELVYSASDIITPVRVNDLPDQVFYTPFVGNIIAPVRVSDLPEQMVYTSYDGSMFVPFVVNDLPNQVFYSATIQEDLH